MKKLRQLVTLTSVLSSVTYFKTGNDYENTDKVWNQILISYKSKYSNVHQNLIQYYLLHQIKKTLNTNSIPMLKNAKYKQKFTIRSHEKKKIKNFQRFLFKSVHLEELDKKRMYKPLMNMHYASYNILSIQMNRKT